MNQATFDRDRTEERCCRLINYSQGASLTPQGFDCVHRGDCSSALPLDLRPLRPENCGGLIHVGEEYDMLIDGRELRVLFVGKDYGMGNADLATRRQSIQGMTDLNWHYKGVVKTLMEIFQPRDSNGWRDLLKRMAQTNAARCCAPRNDRMACNTTYRMRINCWDHFRVEIEILEPTLIVFHGSDLRAPFAECLRGEGVHMGHPLGGTEEHCQEVTWTNFKTKFSSTIIFMNHPFAARYNNFDWERGASIINWMRRENRLPTFSSSRVPLAKEDWPRL